MYTVDPLIEKCSGMPWMPISAVIAYVLLVGHFNGKAGVSWIKTPLDDEDLRFTLRAWNFGLFAFSAWGVANTYHHILNAVLLDNCAPAPLLGEEGRAMGAFALSKFVELGDTFFLIIRGKNVRFIHLFHHASVLLLTWYLFINKASIGPAFVSMNYFVHVMLYLYYVAASLPIGVKLAKKCGPVVTAAQIIQMVFGFSVSAKALAIKLTDSKPCETSSAAAFFALVVYFVYLLMFSHLWVGLYGLPWSPKKAKKDV